jgi:hypothetical protein
VSRTRFALETLLRVRVAEELLRKHLDRNVASQPRVFCAVDLAHSTRADLLDDPVV